PLTAPGSAAARMQRPRQSTRRRQGVQESSLSHWTRSAKIKKAGIEPCPGLVERQLFLHFVLLGFLLGGLLGLLLALLIALLHFSLLVVLYWMSTCVELGQCRVDSNGGRR